jgi:hypothetical protein
VAYLFQQVEMFAPVEYQEGFSEYISGKSGNIDFTTQYRRI